MRLLNASASIAAIFLSTSAFGQNAVDPATVTVPDTSMPKDKSAADALVANGWKYFFFHKAGVSFDRAKTDIVFCRNYLPKVSTLILPGYSGFNGVGTPSRSSTSTPYGLVGMAIGDAIGKTMDRRDLMSRWRRCMETRGYTRYPMAEKVWQGFDGRDPDRDVAILAKLASGPTPDLPVPTK